MSKDIELPLGKRTKLYRFFEILPGVISYSAVILLILLSWFNPVLATIYLLVIISATLVKAVAIARGFVAPSGKNLVCIPAFTDIIIDGEERTAIKLIVEAR